MQQPSPIHHGIFGDEKVQKFLILLEANVHDCLQEINSMSQGSVDKYRRGLETIRHWDNRAQKGEVTNLTKKCSDVHTLYQYTCLLYVKKTHTEKTHLKTKLQIPSLQDFLYQFYLCITEEDMIQSKRYFTVSYTDREVMFQSVLRKCLINATKTVTFVPKEKEQKQIDAVAESDVGEPDDDGVGPSDSMSNLNFPQRQASVRSWKEEAVKTYGTPQPGPVKLTQETLSQIEKGGGPAAIEKAAPAASVTLDDIRQKATKAMSVVSQTVDKRHEAAAIPTVDAVKVPSKKGPSSVVSSSTVVLDNEMKPNKIKEVKPQPGPPSRIHQSSNTSEIKMTPPPAPSTVKPPKPPSSSLSVQSVHSKAPTVIHVEKEKTVQLFSDEDDE